MISIIPPKIRKHISEIYPESVLFYGFLIVYFYFLIFLGQNLVIEEDEAYSLTTTSFNISKILHLSYYFEGQPPVYFILLSLWRLIDNSIFFARLLSIIFILFSAINLHRLIRLFYSEKLAKWLVIIYLLNPYTVWASQEIRLYSLLMFLAITITLEFYLIYYQKKKQHLLFIVLGLLGIYSQYYFAFLIGAFSLIVLLRKGWVHFWKYCLIALIIAVLSLPNLICLKEQFNLHENTLVKYTVFERLRSIFLTPQEFILAITKTPFDRLGRWAVRFFFFFFIIISLANFFKSKKEIEYKGLFKTLADNILVILFQLAIFSLIFILSDLFYYDRYTTIIFPFYCIILGYFGFLNNKLRNFVFVSLALYYLIILLNFYKAPYLKYDDQKSIAKYAELIEEPNEPIVFYDKSLVLRFNQYYNGSNQVVSLPDLDLNLNFFNENFKDTFELNNSIKQKLNKNIQFLLITGNNQVHINNKDLTDEQATEYFTKKYKITLDTIFKGKEEIYDLRIRRLERNILP